MKGFLKITFLICLASSTQLLPTRAVVTRLQKHVNVATASRSYATPIAILARHFTSKHFFQMNRHYLRFDNYLRYARNGDVILFTCHSTTLLDREAQSKAIRLERECDNMSPGSIAKMVQQYKTSKQKVLVVPKHLQHHFTSPVDFILISIWDWQSQSSTKIQESSFEKYFKFKFYGKSWNNWCVILTFTFWKYWQTKENFEDTFQSPEFSLHIFLKIIWFLLPPESVY